MKIEEVRRRLDEIEAAKDDDEVAHELEDQLYRDVLDAIANGADNAHLLAWWALSSRDIEFSRWHA